MAEVATIKAALGTGLADHDEPPSFSVEALTLAGLIQQKIAQRMADSESVRIDLGWQFTCTR
jgi:hypothetical protein